MSPNKRTSVGRERALLKSGYRYFIAGTDNLRPLSGVRAVPQDSRTPGPETNTASPPRSIPARCASAPSLHLSPSLASLFSGRASSAGDRGSAVTWVGGEERKRERTRPSSSTTSSSSAVCSVLCLRLGGRESELLVWRISTSETKPPVSSLVRPRVPPHFPGFVSPRSPWKLLFLSSSALLLPLDSGQQFVLWDLFY